MTRQQPPKLLHHLLSELTGFEHAVVVHSGTAAQQLVMSVCFKNEELVSIPSLGCWSISNAVEKFGAIPVISSIDPYWGIDPIKIQTDSSIIVDLWSTPANWRTKNNAKAIIDLTLAPGAETNGVRAGGFFSCGYLSFGSGKPLDIGAGGVALFNSESDAREARRLTKFGIFDGRWIDISDRYVFSKHLFPFLESCLSDGLTRLSQERNEGIALRNKISERFEGFDSNPLRPNCNLGLRSAIPLLLPLKSSLSPMELEAAALMSGISLTRHPVGTPYLEPAWRGIFYDRDLKSEEISSRLLFLELGQNPFDELERFFQFIDKIFNDAEIYKMPYTLSHKENMSLERLVAEKGSGWRLCRGTDKKTYFYDEYMGIACQL